MSHFVEIDPVLLLLKDSCQAAVLILLVLAAQWALRHRLSPRWRYSLWLLVVIRLVLPCTIPSSTSLFNLLNLPAISPSLTGLPTSPNPQVSAALQSASTGLAEQPDEAPPLPPVVQAPRFGSSFPWLLRLWSVGALALTGFLFVSHHSISRKVARRRPLIDGPVMNLLEDCKQEMGVRVPVTLVETADVGSPALFGFLRPRLLLPAGLTRNFSPTELRYIFLHELGHIKRHDILAGWLITALQILHWFNPLVWLAFHRMRVDRELACDALALSYVRPEENQAYGHTIIKLLESFGRSAWAPSLAGTVENRNQTKERIEMIANFKRTNRGLTLAAALFTALGLITLTDAQPASSQLAKELVGTWILVGAPGQIGLPPAEGGRLKLLTDTSWSVTQTDPKNGAVVFHHGGTYTLKENEYTEHVEFANANTKELIGKTSNFNVKIEGDTLTLIGIGNPWREVWKRVTTPKPQKADPAAIQGTWTGNETGNHSDGIASFIVQGSSFEFHGANTNEWYKAAFSLYETDPKQLLIVITDCPVPDYVGRTAFAIYQLQNGTLTIAGNEPGNPIVPASFDAAGARKFVFKHQ